MPLYTADALILRTYKLGEADRIVVFLTRDRGKKRGVAKGARRPRSRFAAALEPMTEARVAYFEKERRELVGLNYAEPIRSPMALIGGPKGPPLRTFEDRTPHTVEDRTPHAFEDRARDAYEDRARDAYEDRVRDAYEDRVRDAYEDRVRDAYEDRARDAYEDRRGAPSGAPTFDALGYIEYFAELLDEWAQEADADDRLFRLGASMLDALSVGAPVEPLARYFEYWLLRLQGVYPESRGALSDEAMAFLAASRTVAPQQVGKVPAPRAVLRELEHVHRALITMHLEKTLKSDRVLRDLRKHN